MSLDLKQKPVALIIRNLIIVELVAYFVFMIVALSAYWAQLYKNFAISRYIPFTVLEFTGLAAVQILLITLTISKSAGGKPGIREIINSDEHEQLEFKTSFRWDVKRNQVNKELEKSAMKTVAAFLNSNGGSLVIGLDDKKQILGLTADMASLNKNNHDGFENHFNNLFVSMIGPEFRRYVRLSFQYIGDKSICMIQVEPAARPAYLRTENSEDFFIRTGNATTSLKMSQVPTYVSARWHS